MEQQQTIANEVIPSVGAIVRFRGYSEPPLDAEGKEMSPNLFKDDVLKIMDIRKDKEGNTTLEARPCGADGDIIQGREGDVVFPDEVEIESDDVAHDAAVVDEEALVVDDKVAKAKAAKDRKAAKVKAKRAKAKAAKVEEDLEGAMVDEADAIEEAEVMVGATTETVAVAQSGVDVADEIEAEPLPVTSPEGFTHDHEVMLAAGNDVVGAARTLANKDEEINYVLGGLLAKIKDDRLHIEAGYPDTHTGFSDFIEDHVGVKKRKAQYLRKIYVVFQLVGLDKSVLADIGWTKAKELTRLSLEDLEDGDWADIARNTSARELAETVTTRLNAQKGQETIQKKTFNFALTGDTIEIAEQAIARAKSSIESSDPKMAHNEAFEAICVFYNVGIDAAEAGSVLPRNRQQLEDLAVSLGLDITVNGELESEASAEDDEVATQ